MEIGRIEEWVSIVRDSSLSRVDKERRMLQFHARNNHRISTHLLAHGALFGLAIKNREPKKSATQGWLMIAVIPVHSRNYVMRIIRDAVQSPA